MDNVTLIKKEAKTLYFTFKDSNESVINCSTATFVLQVKTAYSDTSYVLTKLAASFDLSEGSSGIVGIALSATDLDLSEGRYIAELIGTFSATNIDKYQFELNITNTVVH